MSVYYQNALRELDLARTERIRVARENADAFYASHPELSHLESDIAAVTRKVLGRIASGACSSEDGAREAQEQIRLLRSEHDSKIRAAGTDPRSLEPQWGCLLCQDTGYRQTPDGNRVMCSCLKTLAARLMIDSDDFRPNAEMTFDRFDLSLFPSEPDPVPGEKQSQHALMSSVLNVAREYADGFRARNASNFILIGQSGLGKTFLSQCIANSVQEKGFTVCSMTAFRLSSLLKDEYLGTSEKSYEEMLLLSDLLVIDDLGSEPIRKNINVESLFSILNERSVSKRPVVIVTNLMPVQLRDRYGERITSRLFSENAVSIRLYGRDVRRSGK